MAKRAMAKSTHHLQKEEAEIFRRIDGLKPKPLDRKVAEVAGIDPTKISNVRRGIRRFQARELDRLRPWLDQLEQVTTLPTIDRAPDIPPTHAAEEDTIEIAALDLSFSMGPGTEIDDYIEETPIKFDLGFLRSITRSPAHRLRLAKGIGDSMFPTLLSSDRIMIDTTQRKLNLGDRVYAISLFGAAAIKRLRTIAPNKVLVISDNPGVDNQEVDAEDLQIAGRVIWSSREL